MTKYATLIDRVTSEEVYTLANEFVQKLCDGLTLNSASLAETHPECLIKDDYESAVTDELMSLGDSGFLDLSETMGLPTKVYDALATIRKNDAWREVAEHLDLEPHTVEALQFWLVSDWLAERLEETGALVAHDVMGFNIWGRTECGQGLDMDSDLKDVLSRMDERMHEALHGPALDQDAAHYGTAE